MPNEPEFQQLKPRDRWLILLGRSWFETLRKQSSANALTPWFREQNFEALVQAETAFPVDIASKQDLESFKIRALDCLEILTEKEPSAEPSKWLMQYRASSNGSPSESRSVKLCAVVESDGKGIAGLLALERIPWHGKKTVMLPDPEFHWLDRLDQDFEKAQRKALEAALEMIGNPQPYPSIIVWGFKPFAEDKVIRSRLFRGASFGGNFALGLSVLLARTQSGVES